LFIVLLTAAHLFLTGCAAAPLLLATGAAGYLATQEEPGQKFEKFLLDLDKSIKQTTQKISGEQPIEEIDSKQPVERQSGEQPTEEIASEEPVGKIAGEKSVSKVVGQQPLKKNAAEKAAGKQKRQNSPSGFILTLQNASISSDTVKTGEEVKFVLRYVVMGAPAEGVKVAGKSTLSTAGKELMVLENNSATKENGTWENTLTFAVPGSATPGKYTITQELSAQGLTRSSQRSFTVL
jgi:hypothetical protein